MTISELQGEALEHLEAIGLDYRVLDGRDVIEVCVRAQRGIYRGLIAPYLLAPGEVELVLMIDSGINVPEAKRTAMAETVVRANLGLHAGNFDLDMSDGLLGYRHELLLADGTLTQAQLMHLLYRGVLLVDRYAHAFNRLIYGDDLSPAEVIAEVEMAE